MTIKFANISGYRIAYHREGTGEVILLVHGIPTYSFIWRSIIPILSANYDVIAIDLLGCGESDKPLDIEYSLIEHKNILKEFLSDLGIDNLHLVGHDIGGGIAQLFSVEFPEMLLDLTLVNSVGYNFWPVQPIAAMRVPVLRQIVMACLNYTSLKLIIKRAMYYKEKVTPELLEYFLKPIQTKEGKKALLHFAESLNNKHLMNIEKKLKKLTMPVLLVRGETDAYLSKSIFEKMHSDISHSKLIRIATAGHFIQEDEPDRLAEIIINFFQENFVEKKSRKGII